VKNDLAFHEIEVDEERTTQYIPPWWKKVHSRIIRGAFFTFEKSLKSALTNCTRGNISHFEMGFLKKKNTTSFITFDDGNFDSYFKDNIICFYSYRSKTTSETGKKRFLSMKDLANDIGWKGITITHDKKSDEYYVNYPVKIDYFPPDDKRHNKQVFSDTGKVISLDPGLRKIFVGYSPQGDLLDIRGSDKIYELLAEIKNLKVARKLSQNTVEKDLNKYYERRTWEKLKNCVDDLHWKTISFLVKNYDVIIVGDIKTKSCISNKGTLNKKSKQVLQQLSFHKFKQRLKWKANIAGKKVILTNEMYTSKACCFCGKINDVGSSEVYQCCGDTIDRDLNGAINILIKTLYMGKFV
jgi:IS605 OrfB family transposase